MLITPLAYSYPAHYFVVREAADGKLSVVFHRLVELRGTPDSSAAPPQSSRLERHLEAVVVDKATGVAAFAPRAITSPWLRAEFPGSRDTDARTFPVGEKQYVLRIPVKPGRLLRLRAAADAQAGTRSGSSGESSSSLMADQTLAVDLDEQDTIARPALPIPPPPSGSASGSLFANGNPANRLDLLIISEGYTASQQSQFIQQATFAANDFLSISPYQDFKHLINVSWLFVPSNEAGADKPSCAATPSSPIIAVDTAFDATFCYAGIRRVVTVNNSKVLAAAVDVPDWDVLIVLVNDTESGGSGGSIAVVTATSGAAQLMQHEFGHSFSLLADEYSVPPYPGYPACSDLSTSAKACEPNVTDQTNRSALKWTRWIAALTPVPTASALADPLATGLWLGARFVSTGMYRQCYNGIMRAGDAFCNVGREAFVKRLYGGGWGAPAQGVSLIEPDASPSGSMISAAVQESIPFRATLAGTKTSGGLAATWLVDGTPVSAESTSHGAQQTFDYTVPDRGTHTVELQVSDSTPFTLDPPSRTRRWTINPGGAIAKHLVAGWNLLGNSTSASIKVAEAFGDASTVNTVWKWDQWSAGGVKWSFYTPALSTKALTDYATGKGYDALGTIYGGDGFWVNAKTPFTVLLPAGTAVASSSFFGIWGGWNLVATGDSATPSAFNSAIGQFAGDNNLVSLWAWNSVSTNWYFYAPSLEKSGGLNNYTASKGYLNFGSKVLEPGMGFWVNH